MRPLSILLAALTLGACNEVHSRRPLVTAADGAPALKPGVWASIDPGCRFDAAAPVALWPACAEGLDIDAGQIRGVRPGDAQDEIAYRLSGASPTVVQVLIERDPGGPPPQGGLAARLGSYQYLGLQARRADARGRVVEAAVWTALCGPPPPKARPGERRRFVTDRPLPGLSVVGDACTAATRAAVRGSVIASRAWSEPQILRWARQSR